MRKVLVVEFKGATDRYTLHLLSSMKNSGYEITLCSVENCLQEPNPGYELIKCFPSYSNGNGKVTKLFKFIIAYFIVLKIAKKKKCDLVHFQYYRNLWIDPLFWFLFKINGFKTVYTAHNILPHEERPFHWNIFKYLYRMFDFIIVTSKVAQCQIEEQFKVEKEKNNIISIGYTGPVLFPKTTKTEARKLIGIEKEKNVVLFFGLIREYKGIDVLLQAAKLLDKGENTFKIIIAGNCSKESVKRKIMEIEDQLGLHDIVEKRIKHIPDEMLPYYLMASDVVVLPYKKMSGQSSVLFLAYQYSRPVIATTVGGLKEVVMEGVTGFLCPPNDAAGLEKCIEGAFSDKDRLIKMGMEAKRLFRRKYSWETIGRETVEVYNRLFT